MTIDKYFVGQPVRITRSPQWPHLMNKVCAIVRSRRWVRRRGSPPDKLHFCYELDIKENGAPFFAAEECLAPIDDDFGRTCDWADLPVAVQELFKHAYKPHV